MDANYIQEAEQQYRHADPTQIIQWAIDTFGDSVAFSTSLAYEDQAITFLLSKVSQNIKIFTLDTGRLFQETYDTIEKTNQFFNINIQIIFPHKEQIEKMIQEKGINLFYESVDNRKLCCHLRKTIPLQETLASQKAWITGLRREQSMTRFGLKKIEFDEHNNIVKINPIADWTERQTIDFVKTNNIPYNPLQDKGYRSLGCMPCTRPVQDNEDVRAGRWWWEQPEHKECGLHKKH